MSKSEHTKENKLTYANSGVDIQAGEKVVDRVKEMARATFTPQTLSEIGSFGALFDASFPGISHPALVSSADGVGTKLKLAFMTGIHHTVGEDLVNHCVNDILVQGAQPLFFMDYFATGKLSPDVATEVISGIATGCRKTGTALIGGETAEMPDFYKVGEYDLAGFIVGVVSRDKVVDGSDITSGDMLLGLASNGLHTNGFTLARQAIFEYAGHEIDKRVDSLGGTIAKALLEIHTCYLGAVSEILNNSESSGITGMAHITGGGIPGNLARIIPDGLCAQVDSSVWSVPPIFSFIENCGKLEREEMFLAFNMGIGYILACRPEAVSKIKEIAERHGHRTYEIGIIQSAENSDADKVFLKKHFLK